MKVAMTDHKTGAATAALSLKTVLMLCLLLLSSVVAIAGGKATATLFFGMLLLFALLVGCLCPKGVLKKRKGP